jgi:hypothetical protein
VEYSEGKPVVVPANAGANFGKSSEDLCASPSDEPPDMEVGTEVFERYDIRILESPSELVLTG